MEQINCTTNRKKYKHLTEKDRYKLEGYLESKVEIKEIAVKSISQIEIKKPIDGLDFSKKFKTITFDNGSEFLDWKSIERSSIDKSKKQKQNI